MADNVKKWAMYTALIYNFGLEYFYFIDHVTLPAALLKTRWRNQLRFAFNKYGESTETAIDFFFILPQFLFFHLNLSNARLLDANPN